jgi:small conductance mechanosensitive channel
MEEQITTVQKLINTAVEFCVNYSFQVLGAIIVLFVGVLIANWVVKLLMALFAKNKLDITLAKFTCGTVRILILAFAVLIALGKFGITIAPFVAAIGALAFGASFAIQGPLSNYGAGLSIILSRPFVVGNTITVAGVSGVVDEVKLACTILSDEDGVQITIPNKEVVGQILHNSYANKIVESMVGVSYSDDPEKSIKAVLGAINQFSEVCQKPGPQVGIQEFGDSSINIGYRYWIPTAKYFQLMTAINLAIFKAIQQAGLTIPFPQREVRMVNQTANV